MVPPTSLVSQSDCYLSLLRAFVKRCLHHLRADVPASHVDLELLAHARVFSGNVGETDILLQKRRRTAGGYFPDTLVADHDSLIVAGNAAIRHFETDQSSFYAFSF